jgi:hypothetical protein
MEELVVAEVFLAVLEKVRPVLNQEVRLVTELAVAHLVKENKIE